jgi:ABC-type uncharacterized transport system ATPase component
MGVAKLVIIAAAAHLTSGTSGASARHRLRPNRRSSNRGPSGIDVSLTDDHFNVGQKRLLFLARAKVRAGSILILAKVTTSVDWETNQLVQKISREDFADSASITAVRPISAILYTDRVAVISEREVVELLAPSESLARDPPSLFRGCIMRAICIWLLFSLRSSYSTTIDPVLLLDQIAISHIRTRTHHCQES